MDGLWTVEFASTEGVFGSGVVVFQDGKILGGDNGYTFVGQYSADNESVRAEIQVEPFVYGIVSVFNTVGKKFTLQLEGIVGRTEGYCQGHPVELPGMRISIKFKKKI